MKGRILTYSLKMVVTVVIFVILMGVNTSSFGGVKKAILFDLSGSITQTPGVYQKAFEILQQETWLYYFIEGDVETVKQAWSSGEIPRGDSVVVVGFASSDCVETLATQKFPENSGYNYRRVYIASRRLMQQFLEALQHLRCNTNYTDIYNALAYTLAIYPEVRQIVIISDMDQTIKRLWELKGEGKNLKIYLINPIKVSRIQEGYEEGEEKRQRISEIFRRSSFRSVEVILVNVIVRRK